MAKMINPSKNKKKTETVIPPQAQERDIVKPLYKKPHLPGNSEVSVVEHDFVTICTDEDPDDPTSPTSTILYEDTTTEVGCNVELPLSPQKEDDSESVISTKTQATVGTSFHI